MKENHTPGLLQVYQPEMSQGNYVAIVTASDKTSDEIEDSPKLAQVWDNNGFNAAADALRLVACWNACVDEDIEYLEGVTKLGTTLRKEMEKALSQKERYQAELCDMERQRDHFEKLAQANAQAIIALVAERDALKVDRDHLLAQDRDTITMVEWLQQANTLHRQVEMLYVVDGYQVQVTWDDHPISEAFHGESLQDAILKAMYSFDLDVRHPYADRPDLMPHEIQINALQTQRDELLNYLREAAQVFRRYELLHRAKVTEDSLAKAEVNDLATRFEATIANAIRR